MVLKYLGFIVVGFIFVNTTSLHAQNATTTTSPKVIEPASQETPPPSALESPRVLIMDLKNNGVAADTVKTLQGILAVQVGAYSALDVISGEDVRRLVALEAEKQSVGCDDSGACMAEIAGALGAGLVIFGDVGQLGELLVVNLNLFNVDTAQSEGRVTIEAPSLESFPGQLKPKAWDLLTPKMIALGFEVPERPTETEPVRLVKEISTPEKPLIAWPGAFLAGTLFLVGAGGAGFWYSDVDSNLRTLYDQKILLEEDGDLLSALSKQNEIDALVPVHTLALSTTIAAGAVGLAGLAVGIFMEPPLGETSEKDANQDD